MEGSDGIQEIISSLLTLLEQLSKSVGSQQSISCMRDELQHYREESIKILEDAADTDCLSEEKASKINDNLTTVVADVKSYIQESKELLEESKSDEVSPQQFDKLLIGCQELLDSLEAGKVTQESTPEEFLSAKDVMSASMSTSFTEQRQDTDQETRTDLTDIIVEEEQEQPTIEGEDLNSTRPSSCNQTTSKSNKVRSLQLCFFHIFCTIFYISHLRQT